MQFNCKMGYSGNEQDYQLIKTSLSKLKVNNQKEVLRYLTNVLPNPTDVVSLDNAQNTVKSVKAQLANKNLFDKNMSFTDENKVTEGAATGYLTYFIQLQPNTKYYAKCFAPVTTDATVTILSSNKAVNSDVSTGVVLSKQLTGWKTELALTTDDTGRLYVGNNANNLDKMKEILLACNLQIELGTTATAYTPYFSDFSTVKVSTYVKNLLNLQGRTDAQPTGNWPISKYDVGNVIYRGFSYTGYYQLSEESKCDVNVNGSTITVIQKVDNYGIGYVVKCRPNTQYTFSATYNLNRFYVKFIDKDGNDLDTGSWGKTFTTTSDTEYIIICLANSTAGTFTVVNPQLEIGTTATDYEPYQGQTYTPTATGEVAGIEVLSPTTNIINDKGLLFTKVIGDDFNYIS